MSSFAALDPKATLPDADLQARLLTPALAIHLDLVRRNVRRVLGHLNGQADRWRPHVKTTKLPLVWEILIEEGVRCFKCATTRELDVLLRTLTASGVTGADVLVAYPHRVPALGRLAELANAHPKVRVSVLVEDLEVISDVPESLGLFLDINSGMDRTGLSATAEDLILDLVRAAGSRYRGLHWYDGHQHAVNLFLRRQAVLDGLTQVAAIVDRISDSLGQLTAEVITAGTPAFLSSIEGSPIDACSGTLHRLSPGTVVFHDLRSQVENRALGLVPAAIMLSRVISHPTVDRITCDAGAKSLAAEVERPSCEVLGYSNLEALPPSEEHLPMRVLDGEAPPRGTLLQLIPWHICPTVNLAEEALIFEKGVFQRTAPIEARAHELLLP